MNGLLVDRGNNERDDITGALICRADLYLQLLEGPQKQVMKTFARIENDDRHTEVDVLISERTLAREFPHWSMLDDPARTWLWTQSEIASGAAIKASKGKFCLFLRGYVPKFKKNLSIKGFGDENVRKNHFNICRS